MQRLWIQNASVLRRGERRVLNLLLEGGRITALHLRELPEAGKTEGVESLDLRGAMLSPGFLHMGLARFEGERLQQASLDFLRHVARNLPSLGCTSWLLALEETGDGEAVLPTVERLRLLQEERGMGARCLGLRLLLTAEKGEEEVTEARFFSYLDSARPFLRLVELRGAMTLRLDFIARLRAEGLCVALGAGDENYISDLRAFEGGASLLSQLERTLHLQAKQPGRFLAAQERAADLELPSETLALHPAVIRYLFETTDRRRFLLHLGEEEGARSSYLEDVAQLQGSTGEAVEKLLPLLTKNPAHLLGQTDCGEIEVGRRADLLVFEREMEPLCCLVAGEVAYSSPF